jgi:hypothetical protein
MIILGREKYQRLPVLPAMLKGQSLRRVSLVFVHASCCVCSRQVLRVELTKSPRVAAEAYESKRWLQGKTPDGKR